MAKTVLITGATSGFGRAAARIFAETGHRVIATGRRAERLTELKGELEASFGSEIFTLCFDVRSETEVNKSIGSLPKEWKSIDILVNNAGLASGLDLLQNGSSEDWNAMIDTNLKGLLYVSKAVIPLMQRSGSGHVINIGSTAGKEVYEKGAVYCASKFAVDAITKGMRIDLLGTGIKVSQISPGAAETEFSLVRFDGDAERARNVYNGYQPMTSEEVGSVIHWVTTLPPNICVNDMVLTSMAQANSFYIKRNL